MINKDQIQNALKVLAVGGAFMVPIAGFPLAAMVAKKLYGDKVSFEKIKEVLSQLVQMKKTQHEQISFKDWMQYSESFKKIMYITRGISGSGKSTLVKTLAPPDNIFSTDDLFMINGEYKFDPKKLGEYHKLNKIRVEEAMKKGISPIVVDNTNTQAWEIKPYVNLADQYGYEIELKEPDTSWRFDAKELAKKNTHGVPEEAIKRMIDRYQHDLSVDDIRNV
jgi:predicted kinase